MCGSLGGGNENLDSFLSIFTGHLAAAVEGLVAAPVLLQHGGAVADALLVPPQLQRAGPQVQAARLGHRLARGAPLPCTAGP